MNIKSFCPTDIIYATITSLGRVIANLRLSGVTSLDDILRRLRTDVGMMPAAGMVTLSVRNCTTGWTGRQNILLRR